MFLGFLLDTQTLVTPSVQSAIKYTRCYASTLYYTPFCRYGVTTFFWGGLQSDSHNYSAMQKQCITITIIIFTTQVPVQLRFSFTLFTVYSLTGQRMEHPITKFHCMGFDVNSLVSNRPFLRLHGCPRYL